MTISAASRRKHGLLRIGPRRGRLTRKEHAAQKRQAADLAKGHDALRQLQVDLKTKADQQVAEHIAINQEKTAREITAVRGAFNERETKIKLAATKLIRDAESKTLKVSDENQQYKAIVERQTEELAELRELLLAHGIVKEPAM
jgi:hypothetical protein